MSSSKRVILGSIFIMISGAIYLIEKALSYFKWAIEIYLAVNKSGGFNSAPEKVHLSDNLYIVLFLFFGICALISAYTHQIKSEQGLK